MLEYFSPARLPDEFGLGRVPTACEVSTLPRSLWNWPTTPVRRQRFDWRFCPPNTTGISGAEGTRTPCLYSAIVALSQMSYSPASRNRVYLSRAAVSNQALTRALTSGAISVILKL